MPPAVPAPQCLVPSVSVNHADISSPAHRLGARALTQRAPLLPRARVHAPPPHPLRPASTLSYRATRWRFPLCPYNSLPRHLPSDRFPGRLLLRHPICHEREVRPKPTIHVAVTTKRHIAHSHHSPPSSPTPRLSSVHALTFQPKQLSRLADVPPRLRFHPTRIDDIRARTRNRIYFLSGLFLESANVSAPDFVKVLILGHSCCATHNELRRPLTPLRATIRRLSRPSRDHRYDLQKHQKTRQVRDQCTIGAGAPAGLRRSPKQRTRGARRAHVAHALRDGQQKRTRSIFCSRRPLLTSFTASPRYRSARDTLVIGRQAGAMAPPTDVGKP